MNKSLFLAWRDKGSSRQWFPIGRLDRDLARSMAKRPRDYAASVVRINPQPAPSKQRVLIEMRGKWDGYEPMKGDDYRPVVGD